MCNQAVSLVAAEIERRGIATVTLILLRSIAERVRPPRALALPFRHGFPLDRPNDPRRQRRVVEAALALLARDGPPPVLVDYEIASVATTP
jgi:hypothetical protein